MAQGKSRRQRVKRTDRSFPRWLVAVGLIAAAFVGYAAQRGGVGIALQEFREAVGWVQRPQILALQPTKADPRTYNVAVENPQLTRVHVTAYYAHPLVILGPWIPVDVQEAPLYRLQAVDEPIQCNLPPHRFPLEKPVSIEPNSITLLTVQPFSEECEFSLVLETSAGPSSEGYWAPRHVGYLREVDEDERRQELRQRGPAFAEYFQKQNAAIDHAVAQD